MSAPDNNLTAAQDVLGLAYYKDDDSAYLQRHAIALVLIDIAESLRKITPQETKHAPVVVPK